MADDPHDVSPAPAKSASAGTMSHNPVRLSAGRRKVETMRIIAPGLFLVFEFMTIGRTEVQVADKGVTGNYPGRGIDHY